MLEDKEQSNTDLERDIINISEIKDKTKWTKQRILEKLSFDTTQHDIYNPEYSSCDLDDLIAEPEENDRIDRSKGFLHDYKIVFEDKPAKHSPIRIKKKSNPKTRMSKNKNSDQFQHTSIFSRNVSQNTKDDNKSLKKISKKTQYSKLYIHSKKKKKLRFSKKKK